MVMRSRTPERGKYAQMRGADNARLGSDCKRPATNTKRPFREARKIATMASNSVFREVVADMKPASWLIGISCAVVIVSADSKVFSQPANQVAQRPGSQWSTIQTY